MFDVAFLDIHIQAARGVSWVNVHIETDGVPNEKARLVENDVDDGARVGAIPRAKEAADERGHLLLHPYLEQRLALVQGEQLGGGAHHT